MVGQQHRLRPLQVGVAGHDDRLAPLGLRQQRGHERRQAVLVAGNGIPQIQMEIEDHLVVAAAAGVHLASHRPDDLGQTPLDGHVDVLVGQCPDERSPPPPPRAICAKPARIWSRSSAVEHADGGQHAHVRAATLDVERGQNVIERDGGMQPLEQRRLGRP